MVNTVHSYRTYESKSRHIPGSHLKSTRKQSNIHSLYFTEMISMDVISTNAKE